MSRSNYVTIPTGTYVDDEQLGRDNRLSYDGAKLAMATPMEPLQLTPGLGNSVEARENAFLSFGYMLAMGVCGIVLVALGSTLESLAENVGKTSTEIGTIFVARGVGAVMGAIVSAKLYKWFTGNRVMCAGLVFVSCILLRMPFVRSYTVMHLFFFFLGLGTAVIDTGCQIMTRKIHGKMAGPWLGANTVSFGISGAFVPIIELFSNSLVVQFFSMFAIVFLVASLIGLGPNPEREGRILSGPPKKANGQESVIPHYRVEFVIGIMVFFLIGGKVTITAYLTAYVNQTNIIDQSHETYLVLALWTSIALGRVAGVTDQKNLTNASLPTHLSVFCIGGFLSILLILCFPKSSEAIWIGIAFYGMFNGPCVGYCYDLNNRMTHPSEISMSIVMFGLNFGASLLPYLTSLTWYDGGGPRTLMIVTFLSMLIPLPLLHISKYLSYDSTVNPWLSPSYSSID